MNDFLIIVLLGAAFLQKTDERLWPALIFAGVAAGHGAIFGGFNGLAYFGSAALCDLIVVFAIARLKAPSWLGRELQRISLVSVLFNWAGWVAWMLYWPSDGYVIAFAILYGYTILTLFRKGRSDGARDRKMDHRHGDLHCGLSSSARDIHSDSGQI